MIDQELIAALAQPQEAARRAAAQEIGESGDPDALAVLLARLKPETSRAVKEAILRGLSRIWGNSPVEAMIDLLRDEDPFVRAEAADMLQRRAGDAIESLNQLMRGDDKDLRKFSIDILSQTAVGVPDALYLKALADEDVNVVISTIENIGAGRRTAYAPQVLAIALESTQAMVICACLDALALIGNAETLAELRGKFPHAVEVQGMYLQPFLKLLGATGDGAALAEICATMQGRGSQVYAVAIDAVSKIVGREQLTRLEPAAEELFCGLLTGPGEATQTSVRFHLLRLLGHFSSSQRVAQVLLPFIHESDRGLVLAAVESLARSNDPSVESALQALLLADPDPEIQEALEERMGRRPRWNSPQSSSPN